MRLTKRKVTTTLRRNGYKLTPQRRAVIRAIASGQDHLTPTEIYEKVRQDYSNIGLVTVYRTLIILAKLNLICELHTGNNCPSYTIGAEGHHHHLTCNHCGKVIDFTGYDLTNLEQRLTLETGFKIDNHMLEFTGLCPDCQREKT